MQEFLNRLLFEKEKMVNFTAGGWEIKIHIYLFLAVLFSMVYAFVSVVSYYFGITNFVFYEVLAMRMLLL